MSAFIFDSRVLYTALVLLAAVGRLLELRVANRNRRLLLERGGIELGSGHYPWMVTLHTVWLFACIAEVWLLDRPFLSWLGFPALAVFLGAFALRYWVISTLGERWTTRIVVLPGVPPITGGPYRWLRHPNYLAVVLEILSLPLVHTAWLTALAFSLLDGILLRVRIRAEEEGLSRLSSYEEAFADRPRLIPGGR
ncbi:MAG TPA: isoprenylcysteine carboxyl methyltransferase family protein [Thermoanaerobaculia bacterium]|nr:isoprenylcysteine carboxyl methyltransferase family protein [Thermoanaerobaculia bacterium]